MIIRFFLFLQIVLLMATCAPQREAQKAKYTIARDPSWYPLQLKAHAIKLVGFTNALVSEIAKDQKVPFNVQDTNWIYLLQGLNSEKFPAIFSPLQINEITTNKFSFSDPIILLGPVLVVRMDTAATSLADLNGKIVGISEFSDAALIVQPYPSILIQPYDNMVLALDDLAQGIIDAVLLDTLDAHALVPTQYPYELKIVSEPLNDKGIRILTLKDQNQDLLTFFNRGLSNLKKSGLYQTIRQEFDLD